MQLLGLRTTIYPATDLPTSKRWFEELLGIEPYFGGEHGFLREVGDGIRVASVLEPGGGVFAIIENPHFAAVPVAPKSGRGR